MFDNLNKELKNIKIYLSEILTNDENKLIYTLYDKNIIIRYDEADGSPIIKIISNNKNYIIIADEISDYYINIEINLIGRKNGNLIVENNENYICNAYRLNEGNGHCIVLGSGYSSARRMNEGNGHAIRLGSGEGDSYRANEGHGYAIRMDSGKGGAYRYDNGNGNAVRSGSGKGDAWRQDEGIGNAIRSGSGEGVAYIRGCSRGHAIKSGSGIGGAHIKENLKRHAIKSWPENDNVTNKIYKKSCALKLGSSKGFAYS